MCDLQFLVGEEMRLIVALLASAMVFVTANASAQSPWYLRCTFTHASISYEEFSPAAFSVSEVEEFVLIYYVDANEIRLFGNVGSSVIDYSAGPLDVLTFTEVTPLGVHQITVVDQRGNAVHSRHTVGFGGVIMPSQYYGRCERL